MREAASKCRQIKGFAKNLPDLRVSAKRSSEYSGYVQDRTRTSVRREAGSGHPPDPARSSAARRGRGLGATRRTPRRAVQATAPYLLDQKVQPVENAQHLSFIRFPEKGPPPASLFTTRMGLTSLPRPIMPCLRAGPFRLKKDVVSLLDHAPGQPRLCQPFRTRVVSASSLRRSSVTIDHSSRTAFLSAASCSVAVWIFACASR